MKYKKWVRIRLVAILAALIIICVITLIIFNCIEQAYDIFIKSYIAEKNNLYGINLITIVSAISLGIVVAIPNIFDLKSILVMPTKENYIKYCEIEKKFLEQIEEDKKDEN